MCQVPILTLTISCPCDTCCCIVTSVSTNTIPQFETRHRLALALEAAEVDVDDMAATLGTHRNTIYNYMSGARNPKLGMIKQWAFRCQVPWQWITTGELPPEDTSEGDVSATVTLKEHRDNWLRKHPDSLLKLVA